MFFCYQWLIFLYLLLKYMIYKRISRVKNIFFEHWISTQSQDQSNQFID